MAILYLPWPCLPWPYLHYGRTHYGPTHCGHTYHGGHHQVWFEGAEVATIDAIPAALLKAVAEARDTLDMARMAQAVARHRRQHLESLEDHPTSLLVDPLLRYCLYEPLGQPDEASHM